MPDTDRRGHCQCKAIRYRIVGKIERVNLCHCGMCQRAHGAPVVAWVTLKESYLALEDEQPKFYRSSERAERGFCPSCGTPMFWRLANRPANGEGLVDVSAATLEDPTTLQPTEHIWLDSAMPWLKLDDDLRRFPQERRD